jgi:hypothetical protein
LSGNPIAGPVRHGTTRWARTARWFFQDAENPITPRRRAEGRFSIDSRFVAIQVEQKRWGDFHKLDSLETATNREKQANLAACKTPLDDRTWGRRHDDFGLSASPDPRLNCPQRPGWRAFRATELTSPIPQ